MLFLTNVRLREFVFFRDMHFTSCMNRINCRDCTDEILQYVSMIIEKLESDSLRYKRAILDVRNIPI